MSIGREAYLFYFAFSKELMLLCHRLHVQQQRTACVAMCVLMHHVIFFRYAVAHYKWRIVARGNTNNGEFTFMNMNLTK